MSVVLPVDSAIIARNFNHGEPDYQDLTGYEASVNQLYVPDDGIDPAADDALAVLAARGHRLAHELLVRVDIDVAPTVLIAYVNVGVWFEGRPGGNLHLHEVHHDEPTWADIDYLDGYQNDGVMAIIADRRPHSR
ncbi:MAG: hypothetical protein WBA97_25190 [Actinophytocola sp.]|uniref:hypothetical protein n=1 Tax=Actinophytocola sp. TaxID=1872138 RepID=UPI003C7760C9